MERAVFEREHGHWVDVISYITLVLAGAFKFIEPWFSFIDYRNTIFMIALLVLSCMMTIIDRMRDGAFTRRLLLIGIAALTLLIGDQGIAYSVSIAVIISFLPLKRSLKVLLITGLIILFFNIICHFTFDFKVEADQINSDGELRHSLGFDHPNTGPILFLVLFSGFILLIDKHKILSYISLAIIAMFIFMMTISRTFFLSLILLLVLAVPVVLLSKTKRLYLLIPSLFVIFTIFSFLLGTVLNVQSLNDLLSGRPYYFNLYIENNSLVWLSGRLVEFDSSWYLDNLFLYLLYHVGVPVYLVSLFGIYFLFVIAKRVYSENFFSRLCLSFTLLMIASMSENFLTLDFNPAYIVLILAFFQERRDRSTYHFIDLLSRDERDVIKEDLYA